MPSGVHREQIERAKQVDLLALIGRDTSLRRVANTGGGEYAGPCPFCGGEDRLRVQPKRGTWWCRQCSEKWDDAIGYVMKRDKLRFPQAVQQLVDGTGKDTSFLLHRGAMGGEAPHDATPVSPSARWQSLMGQYALGCAQVLYSPVGTQGLDWLHARGLRDEVIRKANLGYDVQEQAVVIPTTVRGTLWAIKIRHLFPSACKPKYRFACGSRTGVPYPADWLTRKQTLVVCEGELDTLLLWQVAGDAVDVLTLGASTMRLADCWLPLFQPYRRIVVAMDADVAGVKAERYWLDRFPDAVYLHPPAKDITVGYCTGRDPCDWVFGVSASGFLKVLA